MNVRLGSFWLASLLGCLVVMGGQRALAQEPTPPPAAPDDAPEARVIREQSIYIPYEKLRNVFEKEGRGVFIPYEKFQELWKAARDKTQPTPDGKPPVGALVSESENEATVAKDVVRVAAKLKIEVLAEGWHEIPLRLADAAITRATIGDVPARIVADPAGYKLLVEKKGKEPELIELALEYAKAITSTPGRNQVSLQAPQAPVSRWRVRIPEAGVKVSIQPMIAASEVTGDEVKPDETVLLAFVGAAPAVEIAWTPKAEGATGLAALAGVEAHQQVRIHEGLTRTQAVLQYTISRAKLAALEIEAPADQKVVNVFDPNVRQWKVETTDAVQKITAELYEPAEGRQSVTVELEKFTDEKAAGSIDVPVVRALGVGRQQGVVVVEVAQGLRAEAKTTTGLMQVDAAELPEALRQGKWDFSYRYATVPYRLALAVEKVEPRILVDSAVLVRLRPERLEMDVLATYTIERAGVFRLEWDVPEGYDVRLVRGVGELQVDSHHLTGEKKTRLVVNLARKALGSVMLDVRLARDLAEPDLLTPTGKAAKIPLVIPRVVPEGIERETGRLIVFAPESLRVNPEGDAGLRPISLAEALGSLAGRIEMPGGIPAFGIEFSGGVKPILTFGFDREPVKLSLSAERRRPQVSVSQLLVARIEDDAVKYEATFFLDVLYSGIKTLRIDVPESLADKLRTQTPGVRDKRLDPSPEDVPAGYHAWQFSGTSEWVGRAEIKLAWEEKIDKLDLGKSVPLVVPRLVPAMADAAPVDRSWGQIVAVKAETIDVQPEGEPKALRPIDPQHDLMPGVQVADAAGAWEFHGDWDLTLEATRYELEEVKTTSIELAVARMVVTRADQVAVQFLARVRSAGQRLEVTLPADVEFDSEPLRINGRAVTLERGAAGTVFIPLVGAEPDKPFVIDLRYAAPGNGGTLELPVFPENPAVLKVQLCAYLPEELALVGVTGPWTNEIAWRPSGDACLTWEPTFPLSDAELFAAVCQGVNVSPEEAIKGFQTDGRRYVFATLRPTGPLHLWTINEKLLTGIVLVVVVLGGILLVPCGWGSRVLAVGALVAAIVLCGTFWPILAMQVLDGYLVLALVLVLVVWIIACARRVSCRRPAASWASGGPSPSEANGAPPPSPEAPAAPPADDQEGGPSHA
ncbi:MAG: hypothetical protein JW809_01900 [Pirellulales bacterium]|nr:hypothetical protein [Pirellulales bacterium]